MIEHDYETIIRNAVPSAALYEQLAEECAELAHAALKVAREMRNENPTPLQMQDLLDEVAEEATDVHVVAAVLGLKIRPEYKRFKLERWAHRLDGVKCDDPWGNVNKPMDKRRLKDKVLG